MDLFETLRRAPIFRDLGRDELAELVPHAHERRFKRGEQLWGEGAPATELYIVAEGQLKAHRVSHEGSELILQVISSGEVVGEVGLFHPSGVRRVCVAAMEQTVCVTITRDTLLAFVSRHPPALRRLLESLSEVAVRAVHSFTDVAFVDIHRRVARTLLDLATEQGEPAPDGVRIRLKLSQATLAAMVAATRENVNRALSCFRSRGEVSHRDGYFFVHDRPALEEVVRSM